MTRKSAPHKEAGAIAPSNSLVNTAMAESVMELSCRALSEI